MKDKKEYSDYEQEVFAAIGQLIVAQLKGKDALAFAIFDALVPQFIDRYPYHKILTHIVLGQIREESDEESGTKLKAVPHKLSDLLAQCDPDAPVPADMKKYWIY